LLHPGLKKEKKRKSSKQKPEEHTCPSVLTLTERLTTKHRKPLNVESQRVRSRPGEAFARRFCWAGGTGQNTGSAQNVTIVLWRSDPPGMWHGDSIGCLGR
jgi:hypothetical protein